MDGDQYSPFWRKDKDGQSKHVDALLTPFSTQRGLDQVVLGSVHLTQDRLVLSRKGDDCGRFMEQPDTPPDLFP